MTCQFSQCSTGSRAEYQGREFLPQALAAVELRRRLPGEVSAWLRVALSPNAALTCACDMATGGPAEQRHEVGHRAGQHPANADVRHHDHVRQVPCGPDDLAARVRRGQAAPQARPGEHAAGLASPAPQTPSYCSSARFTFRSLHCCIGCLTQSTGPSMPPQTRDTFQAAFIPVTMMFDMTLSWPSGHGGHQLRLRQEDGDAGPVPARVHLSSRHTPLQARRDDEAAFRRLQQRRRQEAAGRPVRRPPLPLLLLAQQPDAGSYTSANLESSLAVLLTAGCDALQLYGAVPEVHRVRDPHHRVRLHVLSRRLLTTALFPQAALVM